MLAMKEMEELERKNKKEKIYCPSSRPEYSLTDLTVATVAKVDRYQADFFRRFPLVLSDGEIKIKQKWKIIKEVSFTFL